jgi:hypothetical protein
MTRSLMMMAALAGLTLLSCGGAPEESEPLAEVSQELSACTATANCQGTTVSCSGNSTCSTTDYQGVTCDGVFTACPPPPTCSYSTQCTDIQGLRCKPSSTRRYCCDGNYDSWCVCSSSGTYVCI